MIAQRLAIAQLLIKNFLAVKELARSYQTTILPIANLNQLPVKAGQRVYLIQSAN
jgi:hypothetical protein